jgi:hypothetical protein
MANYAIISERGRGKKEVFQVLRYGAYADLRDWCAHSEVGENVLGLERQLCHNL